MTALLGSESDLKTGLGCLRDFFANLAHRPETKPAIVSEQWNNCLGWLDHTRLDPKIIGVRPLLDAAALANLENLELLRRYNLLPPANS